MIDVVDWFIWINLPWRSIVYSQDIKSFFWPTLVLLKSAFFGEHVIMEAIEIILDVKALIQGEVTNKLIIIPHFKTEQVWLLSSIAHLFLWPGN